MSRKISSLFPPCSSKHSLRPREIYPPYRLLTRFYLPGSDEYSQSSEFRVKPKVTLGSVDVPTYCVRFDYNDKYIAAAKGDGSIQIYNIFTGKMSFICNDNMDNPMPTTIMR